MKKSISFKKKSKVYYTPKKNFQKYYLSENSGDFQAVLTIDKLCKS